MIPLLQEMASLLSRTVDAWQNFRHNDLGYFTDMESSDDKSRLPQSFLSMTEKHVLELEHIRKSILDQQNLLERLSQEVGPNRSTAY